MADGNDLISFIASMSGEGNLRVEENLGDGFVRLRVSEAERRQAKHDIQQVEDIVVEMLRNARDAGARSIYIATGKEEGVRTLLFIDDGSGVPEEMRERIFDARVTSKLESMKMDRWGVHGRGMALFSIRQNTLSSEVVASGLKLGFPAFRVTVDTDALPERADQSTWPQTAKDEEGALSCVRGPHNIARAVCEFACEELHGCDVYLGSPTEIAATLYAHSLARVDTTRLLFIDSEGPTPRGRPTRVRVRCRRIHSNRRLHGHRHLGANRASHLGFLDRPASQRRLAPAAGKVRYAQRPGSGRPVP